MRYKVYQISKEIAALLFIALGILALILFMFLVNLECHKYFSSSTHYITTIDWLDTDGNRGPSRVERLPSSQHYTLSYPENDRDVTQRVERINAAKRIICASIPGFFFLTREKHTSCARDDRRLPPEYALTSRSFLR